MAFGESNAPGDPGGRESGIAVVLADERSRLVESSGVSCGVGEQGGEQVEHALVEAGASAQSAGRQGIG
ncbi:hypothetical protein DN536_37360, partial [Burkholderia multivorans]